MSRVGKTNRKTGCRFGYQEHRHTSVTTYTDSILLHNRHKIKVIEQHYRGDFSNRMILRYSTVYTVGLVREEKKIIFVQQVIVMRNYNHCLMTEDVVQQSMLVLSQLLVKRPYISSRITVVKKILVPVQSCYPE